MDNGSQFTSKELDLWAYAIEVILDFSRPGKPTGNAFIDSASIRPSGGVNRMGEARPQAFQLRRAGLSETPFSKLLRPRC